ncbi:unnamed protein product [Schistocephalus solidus]|uniref:Uncharacterized protein n=1 Tax=Schistocephalus solidus TaxID=70667 RepID=A0A183SHF3_SCHSO|nr:unnamed protein product [Schistocephalus solidus]
MMRWAERFQSALNQPSTISDATIDRLPEVEINIDLDLPPPLQKTIKAVQQTSNGKAPGSDAIPAEINKHGGPQLMNRLTLLFQEMWHQWMDDERLPKRSFHGDIAMGSRRQWGQDSETGAAIDEANRIATAKAKRAARKSPAPRNNAADAQALQRISRCQRSFRTRISLVGHLRAQCTTNPTIPTSTSNSANRPSDFPILTPGTNPITLTTI